MAATSQTSGAAAFGNRAARWAANGAAYFSARAYETYQSHSDVTASQVFKGAVQGFGNAFNLACMAVYKTEGYTVMHTVPAKGEETEATREPRTYTINPLMLPDDDAPTSEQLAALLLIITTLRTGATFFNKYKSKAARWRSRIWRGLETYLAAQLAIAEQIRNQDANNITTLKGKLEAEDLLKRQAKEHQQEADKFRQEAEQYQRKAEQYQRKADEQVEKLSAATGKIEALSQELQTYAQRQVEDMNAKQRLLQGMGGTQQQLQAIMDQEADTVAKRQQQLEAERQLIQQRARLNAIELMRDHMRLSGSGDPAQLAALGAEVLTLMDADTVAQIDALAGRLNIGSPVQALRDMQRDTEDGRALFPEGTDGGAADE